MCLQPGWPGGLPRILGPTVSKEERERLGNDSPLKSLSDLPFPQDSLFYSPERPTAKGLRPLPGGHNPREDAEILMPLNGCPGREMGQEGPL